MILCFSSRKQKPTILPVMLPYIYVHENMKHPTQALCFKVSLLWNKIPNKYKNLNSLEELKSQIKQWDPTTYSQVNFIIFCKGSLLDFADGVGCV